MIYLKIIFITLFLGTIAQAQENKAEAAAEAKPAAASAEQVEVVMSGSACPQKQPKKITVPITAEAISVPLHFAVQLDGKKSVLRKTCQSRITFKPGERFHYVITRVSQQVLVNLQKSNSLKAELAFGLVGGKDYQIDETIGPAKENGEYRHILVKKLINYVTPCGKDAVLRLQSNVNFSGLGSNKFESELVEISVERQACSIEE